MEEETLIFAHAASLSQFPVWNNGNRVEAYDVAMNLESADASFHSCGGIALGGWIERYEGKRIEALLPLWSIR